MLHVSAATCECPSEDRGILAWMQTDPTVLQELEDKDNGVPHGIASYRTSVVTAIGLVHLRSTGRPHCTFEPTGLGSSWKILPDALL
jgi:hypothetical protein